MADVNTGIVARLAAVSAVTSLVSTRIYRIHAPEQVAMPYLVIHRISTNPWPAMGGDVNPTDARIQVDVIAATGSACDAAAAAVMDALRRWSGTAGGVTFQQIFYEDEQDTFEEETNAFRKILEFRAYYEE